MVLLSAHAQSVTLADPKWRNLDPSASTRSHARYGARSPAVVRTWMAQSETLLSSFAETPPETILLQGFPEPFIPGRHAQKSLGGRDCKMTHPCNYAFATQRFRR